MADLPEIQFSYSDYNPALKETMKALKAREDVFCFADSLATLREGKVKSRKEHFLRGWLGDRFRYWALDRENNKKYSHPPMNLVSQVLSRAEELKLLEGVVTSPLILPSGTLIETEGYNPESRLYLDFKGEFFPVQQRPSVETVKHSLKILEEPFKYFPFASPLDKSVFLASLLTSCLRPVLPTSPAFGFDAPVQGSGKTLLAKCVATLGTGQPAAISQHIKDRQDDETRKRLFSALLSGDRSLIWDNVTGTFCSSAISGFLTSDSVTDRELGKSQNITVPNRLLLLITGNNLCLDTDISRKVLICRVDPRTERPYASEFSFDPEILIRQDRVKYVTAALNIVMGWLSSLECVRDKKVAGGRMASFETWDYMVRQTVCWVGKEIEPEYKDIMKAVDLSQIADPDLEAWGSFLKAALNTYKNSKFTSSDIHNEVISTCYPENQIRRSLVELTGKDVFTARGIGMILRNRKDRVVNGLSLKKASETNHTSEWLINRDG